MVISQKLSISDPKTIDNLNYEKQSYQKKKLKNTFRLKPPEFHMYVCRGAASLVPGVHRHPQFSEHCHTHIKMQ